MYSVYLLRVPDGRIYIGTTSQKLMRRWNNGNGYRFCKPLWEQIVLHGWENVCKEVLATNLTKEEASEMEQRAIREWNSANPRYGFNRESGGLDGEKIIPPAVKEKMREACTGKRNHNFGKHFSAEHKAKLSKSNLGQKRSEETCKKIGEAKRKPVSQYTLNGLLIATFPSGKEAEAQTGVCAQHISKVCKGKIATAGGYIWSFA